MVSGIVPMVGVGTSMVDTIDIVHRTSHCISISSNQ